jgi:polysaccharide deacetylase 2 family uncharacterized protein YibQ
MAKGKRLKGGRRNRWIGYLVSFLIGSFLTIVGYHYLIQKRPSSQETLSQTILLVDQIIRGQLYEIGLPHKDILLQQSTSQREGDFTWKVSLLRIQVPRTLSFSLIEGNFKKNLSILGKGVSIRSSSGSDSLQLEIIVQNRRTHQLNFVYAKPPPFQAVMEPKIAIVIDDLGEDYQIGQEILRWDVPITFSILPFTPYCKSLAQLAYEKDQEVILHLPMEPYGYPKARPGEGVLLHEMDEEKLLQQLSKDIETVPHIKGVSNHMGSRLMEDPEKLRIVFRDLKRRGLFFLDSRTTPHTVGLHTAKLIGLKATERSLFLDHSQDPEDIQQQLEKLVRLSLTQGRAIGIGHPFPSTLKSIKQMIPKIKAKGIKIVPLSTLME